MKLEKSNWKFDDTVVPIFDEHVSKSVPMYEEIHSLITEISAFFLQDDTNMYDLGTSTGKVLKNLTKNYNKNIKYIGIDNSQDMIERLQKENNEFEVVKLDITNELDVVNASLITSVLTLQFIDIKNRQEIIKKIYNGLNIGGAFILVEKIVGNNTKFNEIWSDLYNDLKLKNGLSPEHILKKSQSIRGVMRTLSIEDNIKMLQNAGFSNIDTFFKWNNFAGMIAIK